MCTVLFYSFFFNFSGALYAYVRLQTILWWLFQNAVMLYGVVRPLHYRSLSDSGRLKYLHLTFVVVGFTLPLIPVLIIHWVGGYGIRVELNYDCLPRNISSVMYSLFIPATICAIIGVSMLLYIASELAIKVYKIQYRIGLFWKPSTSTSGHKLNILYRASYM